MSTYCDLELDTSKQYNFVEIRYAMYEVYYYPNSKRGVVTIQ